MRRLVTAGSVLRVMFAIAVLLIVYLAALALRPSILEMSPPWLRWFGRPESMTTVGIVVAVLVTVVVLTIRTEGSHGLVGVSFTVVAALVTMSAVLGLSAYWRCHDANHPAIYTPLVATAQLITGNVGDFSLNTKTCPSPTPVGLQVAQVATLSAILIGVGGVVVGVFHAQIDRLRANLAESVTAIVGIDDDTQPIISAIARTLDRRSTLVVITSAGDDRVQRTRRQGARVVMVDFNRPSTLVSLRLWRRLGRLYLMSADPATNLSWLELITRQLSEVGHEHRLPLILRIDDPWLAEAWRDQQFGGSNTRWAADVIGKYTVTADRLLESILATKTIQRVFICGTSQLTLALCASMTRRHLERDFYTAPGSTPLPALTLVDSEAEEYLRDHELYRQQAGSMCDGPAIDAVAETPTVSTLRRLIGEGDPKATAAILVDSHVSTTGTRLAARFPDMPVYAWDPKARGTEDSLDIVGMLQPYGLALDTREGQVQDAWERAARLIHERYAATIDPQAPRSPAAMPWAQLNEFYRGSNRRQVRNALWMVEQIAGHTWNTWGSPAAPLSGRDMAGSSPLEQLTRMGFDHHSAMSMAKAEHEDWCRYYRRNGWKYGSPRDDSHKIHDKLVDWSVVESKPEMLNAAVRSLAATLWSLRQLGYRSRPLWEAFTRVATASGEQADDGDGAVVQARPAHAGETIDTVEGPAIAAEGDWVVRGADGEQWRVPGAEFAQRYAATAQARGSGL